MPRVTLVDDDIEFLDELSQYLTANGFTVSVWHRPALAWRFIRRERPEALLLDFDMPGVSGLQILERLRETSETHPIPVLLLTAHDHPEIRTGGWSHQLDDFIPKGTDRAEIRLRLARAVERARENQMQSSFSGLPSGPGAEQRFTEALAGQFEAGSRAARESGQIQEESIFVLQFPGFEEFLRGDRPELLEAFRSGWFRLAHRIRDGLGRTRDRNHSISPAIAWELNPEKIFYCRAVLMESEARGRDSQENVSVRQTLRRRVTAANRYLRSRSGGEPNYLAVKGRQLIRRSLPSFRLHEFCFRDRASLTIEQFCLLGEEALDDPGTPPEFQIHQL